MSPTRSRLRGDKPPRSEPATMGCVSAPGMDRLPTSDDVLAHGFDFRPTWWQSRVDPSWGAFLTDLPTSQQGRGYHHITRRDLLTGSDPTAPNADGRLLLACYVWGTGNGGWLAPRRARVFRDTSPEVLSARLAQARETLHTDGPIAAYAALHDGGPCRVKHMRASFFTKFLYAADAPGDGSPGRALILDRFVAIALNRIDGWVLPEKGGWSPATYGRWLGLAHDLARAESDRTGALVRADAVEFAYFSYGRAHSQEDPPMPGVDAEELADPRPPSLTPRRA